MAEKETPNDVIDVEALPDTAQIETPHEEPDGTGFAGKALLSVALILVGGVLALWIGPKIAPALPSGMAPVAAWLSPGGTEVKAEISSLQQRISEIPTAVSIDEIEVMISAESNRISQELNSRIDAGANVVDTSDIELRLAALELTTEGLRAELSSLLAQLSDVSLAEGEVSAQTTAQIAAYEAILEGVKVEIATLGAQNAALAQKINGVVLDASEQVAQAEDIVLQAETTAAVARDVAVIAAGLSTIDVALSVGLPFAAALSDIEAAGVEGIPAPLSNASGGVVTMASLRADFPEAAHMAIRAAITASSGDGAFAGVGAFLRAQVASRSLTPQEGMDPDAVLSRAEAALKRDDLAGALDEIEALPEVLTSPKTEGLMANWVANARMRLAALDAYETLVLKLASE